MVDNDNIYKSNASNTMYSARNNDKKELLTLIIGGGEIKKQLGYITISNRRNKWARNAKTKRYCQYKTKLST